MGSSRSEILWLYLPGLCALVLSFFLLESTASVAFLIYAFFAREFFDSGHVYTTLWRTYANPEERRRSKVYLYAPLVIFFFFFAWGFFQIPYLGSFIVYATIWHNVRQFYGINKWYQRLNQRTDSIADKFLYFNCFMPFLIAHFRTDYIWNSYYSPQDLFRWPHANLQASLLIVYIFGVCSWLIYELLLLKKHREWNRLLSIAFPTVLYGAAFIFGRTASEIIFPLIVAHGVGYFALMSLAMSRTQKRFANIGAAVAVILLTALFFGTLESYYEDNYLELGSRALSPFVALYLTPLFCHYYFDALIWKGQHPDGKLIYKAS